MLPKHITLFIMGRTLGEAVDQTLEELERKNPEVGARFRREYREEFSQHNISWRSRPDTWLTGIFAELRERMQDVLNQMETQN
jgi:hypothetical protein